MEAKLMKINFSLGEGLNITADLEKELTIDTSNPEAIAKQLEKSPAIMFYWGSAAETATVIEAQVKSRFDRWYSSVYDEIKDELIVKYGKTSTTESTIKHEATKRYPEEAREWAKEMAEARFRKSKLNLARDCFAKKNDNLVNLLAFHRRLAENMDKG